MMNIRQLLQVGEEAKTVSQDFSKVMFIAGLLLAQGTFWGPTHIAFTLVLLLNCL